MSNQVFQAVTTEKIIGGNSLHEAGYPKNYVVATAVSAEYLSFLLEGGQSPLPIHQKNPEGPAPGILNLNPGLRGKLRIVVRDMTPAEIAQGTQHVQPLPDAAHLLRLDRRR